MIVVSWNVRALLKRCIESVQRGAPEANVIVVDNGSSDDSAAMVRDDHPEVELLARDVNLGFTRANNEALRHIGVGRPAPEAPEFVLLLNPDTELEGDALGTLARYMDAHPRAGAVGPRLRFPDGSPQGSCRRFPGLLAGMVESTPLEWHWPGNPISRHMRLGDRILERACTVDWVTGAALMLRIRALDEVGLFDEGFFMYSEELDLCKRLWDAGWEVHFEPRASIVHHEGASSSQAVGQRHLEFQRSRVRYFRKHHGVAAAALVRYAVLSAFALEWLIEAAKWSAGHNRPLRRARMSDYGRILADGLNVAVAQGAQGADEV